jgi:hypothetical protein
VPWQQLVEAILRQIRDSGEHLGKPSYWIHVIEFCRRDESGHDSSTIGSALLPSSMSRVNQPSLSIWSIGLATEAERYLWADI